MLSLRSQTSTFSKVKYEGGGVVSVFVRVTGVCFRRRYGAEGQFLVDILDSDCPSSFFVFGSSSEGEGELTHVPNNAKKVHFITFSGFSVLFLKFLFFLHLFGFIFSTDRR